VPFVIRARLGAVSTVVDKADAKKRSLDYEESLTFSYIVGHEMRKTRMVRFLSHE